MANLLSPHTFSPTSLVPTNVPALLAPEVEVGQLHLGRKSKDSKTKLHTVPPLIALLVLGPHSTIPKPASYIHKPQVDWLLTAARCSH